MRICGYPVRLDRSTEINAFADGDAIILCLGMLKFVKSDDELAAVLGHEMAHNTQKHNRNKSVNAAVGQLLVDLPIRLLLGVNTTVGQRMTTLAPVSALGATVAAPVTTMQSSRAVTPSRL